MAVDRQRLDKASEDFRYFSSDFSPVRFFHWHSLWYQAREAITDPAVHRVLEFGPGRAVTKALIEHFGLDHVSVDMTDAFHHDADVRSTIGEFASDETFDMVCAFEVLEHNPLEEVPELLAKFAKLSHRYVFVSVPFSGRWISGALSLNLPRFTRNLSWTWVAERRRGITRPVETYRRSPDPHRYHWWEVGDRDMRRRDFRAMMVAAGLTPVREFHNALFPYHYFMLARVDAVGADGGATA